MDIHSKISGTMLKDGRIFLSIPELRNSPGFFPKNGEITIDDGRDACLGSTTQGRFFIKGLKGYIKPSTKVEIEKLAETEYRINILKVKENCKDSKVNNPQSMVKEIVDDDIGIEYKPIEVNVLNSEKSVEEKAVRLFEEYMHSNSDRFAAIVKGGKVKSDIRRCRNGYNSVFADYVVYDKVKKANVYFEIKGTSKNDQYWGGVTFKEIRSALLNQGNYYFAIICIDSTRKDPFIHSGQGSDPYHVFMDLEEFMKYSTRASLGIQFVIKYPNGEKGELQMTKNGENAYSLDDMKSILDDNFIQKLMSD